MSRPRLPRARSAPRKGCNIRRLTASTSWSRGFAYFVDPKLGVPGYYFAVGGTPQAAFDAGKAGGPPVPSHHSPLFKIAPEPSITLGTEAMVLATLELLKR